MMLQPLIATPRNKKERKASLVRIAQARAVYGEVQRLSSVILTLDGIRAFLLEQQLGMAAELLAAGAPMEGVRWVEADGEVVR